MSAERPSEFRALTREIEFRVRYAETDQMGVVYHANYLVWCEMGRTDLIRSLGMSYADMERSGILLAVSDLSVRYHAPARYEELIRVRTTLTDLRSRLIAFEYLVANAETDQRLATAQTRLVSLDRSGRPVAMPEQIRALFY
jgi:acyl-CoA thioester hydrolase